MAVPSPREGGTGADPGPDGHREARSGVTPLASKAALEHEVGDQRELRESRKGIAQTEDGFGVCPGHRAEVRSGVKSAVVHLG